MRIQLSGVFDGSRAMQLIHFLRSNEATEIVADFADVERFEAFGVDVLLTELAAFEGAETTVRCSGVPPCIVERLDEIGVAVSSSLRHPRWAPWA